MSENETTDRVFETIVELGDGWTAAIVAYDDGTVCVEWDPGVLEPDAATRLALALSAAAYAATQA